MGTKAAFQVAVLNIINMELRIATFNVFYGKNPTAIADAIKTNENLCRADVILLQEVEAHPHETKARALQMAELLDMRCVYTPARESTEKGVDVAGSHGLAILSKEKIKEFEVVPLSYFNLRYNSRKRVAVNAILEIDGKEIQISNVHLDNRLNIKDRILQIKDVLEKLKSHRVQRIVMAGDFNTVPFFWLGRAIPIFYSSQRKLFNRFLREEGFDTHLEEAGHTMAHRFLKLSLDSIYTKGVRVKKFGVERTVRVSDHWPVWVDVEV